MLPLTFSELYKHRNTIPKSKMPCEYKYLNEITITRKTGNISLLNFLSTTFNYARKPQFTNTKVYENAVFGFICDLLGTLK